MAKGKEIIRGRGASPGTVVGTVRVVNQDEEKMAKIEAGEIMVSERTTPEHEAYMARAAALITDVGGKLSHTGIVAREMGKPAVVGTEEGTAVLKDGQKVVVDGTEGVVYEYVEEEAPEKPSIAEKMAELAAKKGIKIDEAFLKKMRERG